LSLRVRYLRGVLDRRATGIALAVLARATRRSPRDLRVYLREAEPIVQHILAAQSDYVKHIQQGASGILHDTELRFVYALVRGLAAERVVETGTANGSSTAVILAALDAAGRGTLTSVDLPFLGEERRSLVPGHEIWEHDASVIPDGRSPGWMVPDELRGRWELELGDARELLPPLLERLGSLDVFFHDSLHTRDHMLFEFECAWPRIRRGGVLLSDDVFQRRHDAIQAFAGSVGRPFSTFSGLGLVRHL
jgi:predicted O-methyltransferase YrrM